jgi:CHAT domain-containing protein
MGDESTAWHYEMAALRSLPDVREARKRFLVWDEAEFILRQSGDLGAALSFQDEIIAASSATSRPGLKVTSFEEKAAICDELGWREEAWKAVGAAKRHLVDIRDEAVRTNLSGDLMVAEAQLVAASDPERAVSLLNPALQFYGKRDYAYKLADLHFQRAQAYARMGSLDRAEADLIASIAGIEQQRRDIPEASIQEQFFEQAGRVFTLMAKVQLRLGRPQVALGYIERLRSKPSLISVDVSTKASVEIVDRVQRMLPTGTVIVDLVLLDNRIHVWILRRDLIRDFDLTSQASTISLKIKEYSDALSKSNENLCSRLSRELGNILLAEIMPSLESAKRVIFIPDGPLNKVPFAALQNPDTSHYLVQSYAIAVAPSAAVYAQAVSRAVSLGERFGSVLAVGDPDFDRSLWPSTKSLGEAREEVGQVAALYPRSKKLVGKEATIAEFEQSAQVYNVLHIAAHAFVNREQPLLSLLLFSPSASQGDAGALYVRDLYKLKLSETRLVVLAACSSLGEGSGGRYGLSSLARPFLAAGVPSVIGTLWPVGDYEALKFIVRFHKDLLLLGDPMRALQKTQVDSIAASGPRSSRNSVWAAFQILGS